MPRIPRSSGNAGQTTWPNIEINTTHLEGLTVLKSTFQNALENTRQAKALYANCFQGGNVTSADQRTDYPLIIATGVAASEGYSAITATTFLEGPRTAFLS